MKDLAIFGIVVIIFLYSGLQHLFNWLYRESFKDDKPDFNLFVPVCIVHIVITFLFLYFIKYIVITF